MHSLTTRDVAKRGLFELLESDVERQRREGGPLMRPLVAESPAMRRALALAERAAAARSTVLLIGETGTGKEQLARHIHDLSPRCEGPFVPVNCAALPSGLLESELFGHEKGAFTGADQRRLGRFELANGGTLLLDEVGELPGPAQVALLRVLQEREITRLGGGQPVRVDVRLIAATHRDLRAEVRAGRFREDLFFRVHVVPVELPPLRERPEDIEPLAQLFLERFGRAAGRPARALSASALALLLRHPWPGNVRELQNIAERLVVVGEAGSIEAEELAAVLPGVSPEDAPAAECPPSLWEQERRLLVEALARTGHNQTHAARQLQISREQLRTRIKRYGLLAG